MTMKVPTSPTLPTPASLLPPPAAGPRGLAPCRRLQPLLARSWFILCAAPAVSVAAPCPPSDRVVPTERRAPFGTDNPFRTATRWSVSTWLHPNQVLQIWRSLVDPGTLKFTGATVLTSHSLFTDDFTISRSLKQLSILVDASAVWWHSQVAGVGFLFLSVSLT